jgi:hypothetical protein
MDDKQQNQSLDIHLTDVEWKRVSECASAERMSPNSWARLVVTDIARRVSRLHTPESEK